MTSTQEIEISQTPSTEDFAQLLEESFVTSSMEEGSVVKGKVVAFEKDLAVIDVGLKTEGRVPLLWSYGDGRYIKSVHKRFGKAKLKSYPNLTLLNFIYF